MSEQTALEDQPLEQRTSLWSLPLEGLRTLLQGLWACRVSLLSLVAGIYVLWNVAQAHDLFVELKKTPRFAGTPFIFLTAVDDELAQTFGRKLGVDAYLTKPVDIDALVAIVSARLAKLA